ncbi:31367_t:CDS:2 [Gigaspora margarita]|uniref:General transcription and DNA repair factor IIH subunit TFB4 n=1 Tax=Gigaspora margarita TaxID=4874 RepID=A0ABN7VL46_GIGMA|nr:31367_t:CDS:2 [Gigaspora margarita]
MSVLKDTATVNEEDANLLVLIIDTNPIVWRKSNFSLKEALRHILVFINAHLALKHDNDVAIIASHVGVSKFLYPIPMTHENSDKTIFPNMYQKFRVIDEKVIANMSALFEDVDTPNNYPDKGLCIPIDVCKVYGSDTPVFLQQASHITGGKYLKLEMPQGLLQFLMVYLN